MKGGTTLLSAFEYSVTKSDSLLLKCFSEVFVAYVLGLIFLGK